MNSAYIPARQNTAKDRVFPESEFPHFLSFFVLLTPIHVRNFFAQNPSSDQFYSVFIVKPIHVPKIYVQNASKPIHTEILRIFGK